MDSCYCQPIDYPEGSVLIDYLYVDCNRLDVCVVTRVIKHEPQSCKDVPIYHRNIFLETDSDGNVIEDKLSEVILFPVALYPDPFRRGKSKMVLCEVRKDLDSPTAINTRHQLADIVKRFDEHEPWMGCEQEFLFKGKYREHQQIFGKSQNMLGMIGQISKTCFERHMVEKHMSACLYAGVSVFGMTREYVKSQWEYQLGPADPLSLADDLVVSRYLLNRIAEMHDVYVTFLPKAENVTVASALHISFSSKAMREDGGIREIHSMLDKLSKIPQDKLLPHFDRRGGKDNELRLTGKSFAPSTTEFKIGLADKSGSVRIPLTVLLDGKGYFEERRPSSDCDPYSLLSVYLKAILFDEII